MELLQLLAAFKGPGELQGTQASDFRGLRRGVFPSPLLLSPPLETGCSGAFQWRPGLPPVPTGLAVLNADKRSRLLSAKH